MSATDHMGIGQFGGTISADQKAGLPDKDTSLSWPIKDVFAADISSDISWLFVEFTCFASSFFPRCDELTFDGF